MADALFCFCTHHLGMRKDFWPRKGPFMERRLCMMMDSEPPRFWEQYLKRYGWKFYPIECVERDHEYYLRYTYHPERAFSSRFTLSTFIAWRLVRLIWHYEVDTSGEAT